MHSAATSDPFCDENQAWPIVEERLFLNKQAIVSSLRTVWTWSFVTRPVRKGKSYTWLAAGAWGWVITFPASNTSARPTSYTACAPSAPVSPAAVNCNWEKRSCYLSQFKTYFAHEKTEIWKMMLLSNPSNHFPLIPVTARRDMCSWLERKLLHHWPWHSENDMQSVPKSKQGSTARQNKFKTILYYLIGLVFLLFLVFESSTGKAFICLLYTKGSQGN